MTNRRRLLLSVLVAVATALAHVPTVRGWGNEGHRAVALIAEAQLSPGAKATVSSLLGGKGLHQIATCPDEVRAHERDPTFQLSATCLQVFPAPQPVGTANWHFVDLDVMVADPTDAGLAAICNQDCVVDKIVFFHDELAKKNLGTLVRAQALAFLVHFVGDVHQPLHAAERSGDHGGNLVTVRMQTVQGSHRALIQENLHSVWDSAILDTIAGDESALVNLLGPQIATARTEKPLALNSWVVKWARESEDAARTIAYQDGGPISATTKPVLSKTYESKAASTIKSQIAKGGFRLATLINDALK
jgi:hypothetical protein